MEEVKNMGRKEYTEHLMFKYNDVMNTITENDRISTGKDVEHLYTWERIYHFSCGNCTKNEMYRLHSRGHGIAF